MGDTNANVLPDKLVRGKKRRLYNQARDARLAAETAAAEVALAKAGTAEAAAKAAAAEAARAVAARAVGGCCGFRGRCTGKSRIRDLS